MQKKLVVLFIIVLLAFAGLSARLVWLAREKGTQYQKQVLSQQRYDSTTIPYRRGDIVDSKGTAIATSEKVYNLVIDAKVMNTVLGDKQPYLKPTLTALEQCFDLNMSEIRAYVNDNPNSSYYVPLKQLTYDEISDFKAAQAADKNNYIQGVWFEEEYRRVYPYGSLAADVIGFTNKDNQGSYGLEEYYNSTLNGINGREYGYLNDDLNLERTIQPAVDGNTIHTTIDINAQMIVEKYLKKFNDDHKDGYKEGNGAEHLGCVIMRINTGEILAMAEYPNYDLNDPRNTDSLIGSMMVEQVQNANGYYEIHKTGTVINEEALAEMDETQLYANLNNLWKNYCIASTYEPGSTAKPFTLAAALETAMISPNATFECHGSMEVGDYTIKCHSIYGEGTQTVEQAMANSCNVAFMKIGQVIGKTNYAEYQQIFNFGLRTNIDLAGEARTDSLVYTVDQMGPTDLATNSFGQNFHVSMIQMITGYCSLINGGYYYEPHVVNKITNSNGATVANIEPRVLKQTVSESTSALIRQFSETVVKEGTGHTARPAGYMIGGKTGTAETIDENTRKRSETDYVLSFIGYAPADDPQIAIYVVVDRPNVADQSDAKFATRLARSILMEVLPCLNIFMTEELDAEEIAELEALKLEITTQYTRKPEDEALEDEGEDPEVDYSQHFNADGTQPAWLSFPIDEATGYRIDPSTGDKYDAKAGFLVEGGSGQVLDPNMPVNNNLIYPPQE